MRILHTADWHLGKKLDAFSRLEEQREVLGEICDIADREKVDVVLIAGDLYDTYNPPAEAVDLFYKTVKRLTNNGKRAVIAIAGNHDSPERIEAPDPLARECGIIFVGFPNAVIPTCKLESGICVSKNDKGFIELSLPDYAYPLRVILTPYANEYRLKTFFAAENQGDEYRTVIANIWKNLALQYCDPEGVNLLLAHLYLMKKGDPPPEESDDEKPILHVGGAEAIFSENIPPQIQYTALGHLHRYHRISGAAGKVAYSSSPLAYSFSEANRDKYVIIVEAEPRHPVNLKPIKLSSGKPLLRKTFTNTEDAVQWLKGNQEAWVELTMVTDKFLTAESNKLLAEAHPGIVRIIPEVKDKTYLESITCKPVDLSKSMEELFQEYFRSKYGNTPNDEIMDLFKEVQAEQPEKE